MKVRTPSFLLLFVAAEIRICQGKVLEGGKVALDAIEPGTICRCEVEADVMPLRPLLDLPFEMRAVVVHNDMELLRARVSRTDPTEE